MHKVQTSTLSLYTKLEMDEEALGPCGCLLVVKSLKVNERSSSYFSPYYETYQCYWLNFNQLVILGTHLDFHQNTSYITFFGSFVGVSSLFIKELLIVSEHPLPLKS